MKKYYKYVCIFLILLTLVIGWTIGYYMGIKDAEKIINEIFNQSKDGITVKGYMPW